MLISVHLPKTAGTSFCAALEETYGDRLVRDYEDKPIRTPVEERNKAALRNSRLNQEKDYSNVKCIHGHFLPVKYSLCKGTRFVTWVRHPLARLKSHYTYWKRNYHPERASLLHRRMINENWSLDRFCMAAELKNLYSQYLWNFPLEKFDFIGITEHYESELLYFSKIILKAELKAHRKNTNPSQINPITFESKASIERIQLFHEKDILLYKRALSIRAATRAVVHTPHTKPSV